MQLIDRLNLGEGFSKYFRIDAALDEGLRDEVFRIRHSVYCEDLQFESTRPDGREIDHYDAHSVHCLLRTATAPFRPVGCARVVLTNPSDPAAPLPFEVSCASGLDRSIMDPARLPGDRIAEISRLPVNRDYRRRRGEEHTPVHIDPLDFLPNGAPMDPLVTTSRQIVIWDVEHFSALRSHLDWWGIATDQLRVHASPKCSDALLSKAAEYGFKPESCHQAPCPQIDLVRTGPSGEFKVEQSGSGAEGK